MLVYDYSWNNILLLFLIIFTNIFYRDNNHPSRIIVSTFVLGYLLCPNRVYDIIATILYIFKYSPRHITMIYGTITIMSIMKSIILSMWNMQIYIVIWKTVCILCCLEYNRVLEILNIDPSCNNEDVIRYKKIMYNNDDIYNMLSFAWHLCASCYLFMNFI